MEIIEPRAATLGGAAVVSRLLPTRNRRTLGSWCFLDHFRTSGTGGTSGIAVGPHPHIGLQTVTWLLAGEVLHLDSIGSRQPIRPGELNLMTSGRGIAHAEIDPASGGGAVHGLQFWVALPEGARQNEPAFEHHRELPSLCADRWRLTVFLGSLAGLTSPATAYTPGFGAELVVERGRVELPLDAAHEWACFVVSGTVRLEAGAGRAGEGRWTDVPVQRLAAVDPGATAVRLEALEPSVVFLIGGEPFPDPVHMWWNFVAGTRSELTTAVDDWNAGERFGVVEGSGLERVPAPVPPWARRGEER